MLNLSDLTVQGPFLRTERFLVCTRHFCGQAFFDLTFSKSKKVVCWFDRHHSLLTESQAKNASTACLEITERPFAAPSRQRKGMAVRGMPSEEPVR